LISKISLFFEVNNNISIPSILLIISKAYFGFITIKEVAQASASMQLSEITEALRILLDKAAPVNGLIIWAYLSPVIGSILNFL